MKEFAKGVERERALKDVAEAMSKERAKVDATAEKKAAAFEKAKALVEKRLVDFEAKVGETKLKLVEAESLNTARAEKLANLRADLKGCESKWYNEGFANAENSVEPVIYFLLSRDGNLCPTRGYPTRLNPNRSGFTRSDKE